MKRKIEGRIYSLKNPLENNTIFYIGQTVLPIQDRLKTHLRESKVTVSYKNDIIRKIIESGQKVIIEEIEHFSGDSFKAFDKEMNEREKYWINKYPNLSNSSFYEVYIKNCDNCKATFEAKRAGARFCSDICRASYHQRNNQENGDRLIKIKAEQVKFVQIRHPEIKNGKQLFDFLYDEYCKLYKVEKQSVFQAETKKVYDSPKLATSFQDEPKQWQVPETDNLQVWKTEMNNCENIEELNYVGQKISASGLSRWEQNILTKYGKLTCERKGFI